jgi:hypothetical protein
MAVRFASSSFVMTSVPTPQARAQPRSVAVWSAFTLWPSATTTLAGAAAQARSSAATARRVGAREGAVGRGVGEESRPDEP